jgi:N-acetylneuraminic acid mutarotase
MIVWGGQGSSGYFNDGGRYNPSGNSWTAVSTTGAPTARIFHTAVWTGSEMIVWGGLGNLVPPFLNDGGRFNPVGNSWTAMSTMTSPAPRYTHTAVWTGSEMIVWGGIAFAGRFGDTFSYTPGRVMFLYQRP